MRRGFILIDYWGHFICERATSSKHTTMALWLIRAGRHGEQEALALEKGAAIIGWQELPDLSGIKDRDKLGELLSEVYPNEKQKTLSNWESQLWPVVHTIQPKDLVVLPLKTRSMIEIGRITGAYQYRKDIADRGLHTRPVKWIKELPRSAFDQDLLYSFGAFMTVCRIQRGQAEERVRALLENKPIATATPAAEESSDLTARLTSNRAPATRSANTLVANFAAMNWQTWLQRSSRRRATSCKYHPKAPMVGST
jgi:predicted Mrr-cat superfamily restriction endonuclease